jgi:hypothetical protein
VFFENFVVNNVLFVFVVNFSTSNFWLFRLKTPLCPASASAGICSAEAYANAPKFER